MNKYVLERSGVHWEKRFYVGQSTFHCEALWGPLDRAFEFHRQSDAVRMSHQIDDQEGLYTRVSDASELEAKDE